MKINDVVFEKYPENLSSELMCHTRHVTEVSPKGLSAACMKDVDPDFHKKLEKGKIMVAGKNFGCNSSREWAPVALLHSGVKLIIAPTFSRIFYRNAINIGLPILECGNIGIFNPGDKLEVDLSTGVINNVTSGKKEQGTVLPDFLLDIMTVGGLMEKLKKGA